MTTNDPQRPVVDLAVEGWARLARIRGFDQASELRKFPVLRDGPHEAGCPCLACEGQLGAPPVLP